MDSQKRNLFRNTALHSFTLRGENNKRMQGLMNHMQNLLNNLFGKMEHVKEVCEKLALSFLQCLILYYYWNTKGDIELVKTDNFISEE